MVLYSIFLSVVFFYILFFNVFIYWCIFVNRSFIAYYLFRNECVLLLLPNNTPAFFLHHQILPFFALMASSS